MAKSIFQVEVDDRQFQEYQKSFNKYQEALKKTPEAWAKVTKGIDASRKSFDTMVAGLIAAQGKAQLMADAQKKIDLASRTTADRWREIARSTRSAAGSIIDATTQLLKWTALTSVFTGVLGAGGLFGIDRLASGVGARTRSAQGLGLSYGEQSAFGVDFGRLVDPDSFLAGVNQALHSAQGRVALYGAGLSPQQITGDTADVAVNLIPALKRIADNTNPALYADTIQARQLDQFGVTPEYLERLHGQTTEEIQKQYEQDKNNLELSKETQKAWQDLSVQLNRAGLQIENVFAKGLEKLAGPLSHLSDSFVDVVKAFSNSDLLKHWIDAASSSLEQFASYIGTPDFQQSVQNFVDDMKLLGDAVAGVVNFIDSIIHPTGGGKNWSAIGESNRSSNSWWGRLFGAQPGDADPFGKMMHGGYRDSSAASSNLLGLVQSLERSGDSAISPKGAVGRYQITPGTALQYGGDPSRLADPAYAAGLAAKILNDLENRYHGNTAEVLAAYNAGPGVADRFAKSGDNPNTLPSETRAYLARAQAMPGYQPRITVTVLNNTGGNAIVQTAQVAY
jgi:hypothetical protein